MRRHSALAGAFLAAALAFGAPAEAQTEIWSADITTGALSTLVGVWPSRPVGTITDRDFDYGVDADMNAVTYNVSHIRVSSSGGLQFSLSPKSWTSDMLSKLTFKVGSSSFALSDATISGSGSAANWSSAALSWSSGDTVSLKLVDSTSAANNDPEITTTSPRSVAENTTAVATLAATDADSGDTLAWSKNGGADAGKFDLTTAGVLTFIAAPDYEDPTDTGTDNGYEVIVRVSDGTANVDLTLTVNVTDADEKPVKPAMPAVTATAGSTTGLDVTWVKPGLNGGPDITGYKVEYRAGSSGGWTDHPHSGTGTTATISGLAASTSYQVQVRAVNGETDSDWSDPGTGRTATPRAPGTNTAPTGADKTVTMAEDTVYSFQTGDFGFADADTGAVLASVTIVTLPSAGSLELFGLPAAVGETVSRYDLGGGLAFAPAANAHGTGYASFTFKVGDGTAQSASAYTMTIDVRADDTLDALALSVGTLNTPFAPATQAYTASVANSVARITVTPTAFLRTATLEFLDADYAARDDADAAVAGHQVDLAVGANTVKIRVTPADRLRTRTYTVLVTRAAAAADDATLFDLALSAGEAQSGVRPRHAELHRLGGELGGADHGDARGEPGRGGAGIPRCGQRGAGRRGCRDRRPPGGSRGGRENTIRVKVTAPDGTTEKTYTAVVTRMTSNAAPTGADVTISRLAGPGLRLPGRGFRLRRHGRGRRAGERDRRDAALGGLPHPRRDGGDGRPGRGRGRHRRGQAELQGGGRRRSCSRLCELHLQGERRRRRELAGQHRDHPRLGPADSIRAAVGDRGADCAIPPAMSTWATRSRAATGGCA